MADVREELLATLTALADFAYGWGLLDAHVPRLQAAVSVLPQNLLPVDRSSPAGLDSGDLEVEAHLDDAVSARGASTAVSRCLSPIVGNHLHPSHNSKARLSKTCSWRGGDLLQKPTILSKMERIEQT